MFARDAPKGALVAMPNRKKFAKLDIPKGSILTESMLSQSPIDFSENQKRIIFIPTKDKFSKDISTRADLISVSPDGFGAQTIAADVKIMFDLSAEIQESNSAQDNPGYFVEIDELDAEEIVLALSTGEVRFALKGSTR